MLRRQCLQHEPHHWRRAHRRITLAEPALDLIETPLGALVTTISSPPAVPRVVDPNGTSFALMAPGTTCLSKTAVRASLSASRAVRASCGTLAKASFVGANTVKGPAPLR